MVYYGMNTKRLEYVIGKTLIHFELHEGPSNCSMVIPLFSMPKKLIWLADMIVELKIGG